MSLSNVCLPLAVLALLTIVAADELSKQWQPVSCPDKCHCSNLFSDRFQAALRTVDCENRGLRRFPGPQLPADVQVLLLSGNNIESIESEELLQLPDLLHLKLPHNSISKIGSNAVFEGMYNLRVLDLHDNLLVHLNSDCFQGLFNLEELNLHGNRIVAMGNEVFRGLDNLQTLYLTKNKLTYIQADWWPKIQSLFQLHLASNYLAYLQQDAFNTLPNLLTLDLSHNRLFKIHEQALSALSKLEILHLDSNSLPAVPSEAISSLKSLRSLNLGHNPVVRVAQNAFSGLPLLKDITLTGMPRLRLIDRHAMANLPELLVLSVHDNPSLAYVDAEFAVSCPKLTHLLLHNNNISAIERKLIDSFPALREISFYGNALACDCTSVWLREYIGRSQSVFREAERMVCDYPRETQFKLFASLSVAELSKSCTPRMISLFEYENNAKLGDEFSLDCRAIGWPMPEMVWIAPSGAIINAKFLEENARFAVVNRGTLVVKHVKATDAGLYTCIAENDAGEVSLEASLKVDNIDVAVFPIRVSSNAATIIWNGQDREQKVFQILLRSLGNANGAEQSHRHRYAGTVTPLMHSYTLKQLAPETNYEVCMAVEDGDVVMHISCTRFATKKASTGGQLFIQGIERTSNVAVGTALGIVACLLIVVCVVAVGFKRSPGYHRYQSYDRLDRLVHVEEGSGAVANCYSNSVEPTPNILLSANCDSKLTKFKFPSHASLASNNNYATVVAKTPSRKLSTSCADI